MFAKWSQRAKALGVLGAAVTAFVIGAWTLPSDAVKGGGLVGPVTPALALAPGVDADRTMTIDINWPAGDIPDNFFCLAYALVYNGTEPYTFTWSGQFDNSYASNGPLGVNQIVSGVTSSSRASYLILKVEDSHSPTHNILWDTVSWNWGGDGEDCGA